MICGARKVSTLPRFHLHDRVAGLAHGQTREILIATLSATVSGARSALAQFAGLFGGSRDAQGRAAKTTGGIIVALLAPIAAMLIRLAT